MRRTPGGLPTRDALLTTAVVTIACAVTAPAPVVAEGHGAWRPWIEAATTQHENDRGFEKDSGVSLGAGADIGHTLAFVMGVEYAFLGTPGAVTHHDPVNPANDVRVEGTSARSISTAEIGLRLAPPVGAWVPCLELGFGVMSDHGANWRATYVGQPGQPSDAWGGTHDSFLLVSLGAGVRTHREQGLDGYLAVRSRRYAMPIEGGGGSSLQVRLGVLLP